MTSAVQGDRLVLDELQYLLPRRSRLRGLLRLALNNPVGVVAAVMLAAMALAALFADQVAPYSPTADVSLAPGLSGPSADNWLGVDKIGRDMLSRLIHGARISLGVSFAAVGAGTLIGSAIGMLSGFVGGGFDLIAQRFMDMLMAIPAFILALVIVASFGNGSNNAMIAIAIVLIPTNARVMRSVVLGIKARMYVESARASGASWRRVLMRHILPNALDEILILASVALGAAVIIEASLSFLGLGVQPPTPSWGRMLAEGRGTLAAAPHLVWAPSAAIALTVLTVTMIGDTLRDILDPKVRGGRSRLG